MSDQTLSCIHKSGTAYNHDDDDDDQFLVPTFNIGELPLELQDMILLKAVVERRLTSGTFGEVYDALAVVCQLWKDIMTTPVFYDSVARLTFLKDPMCRYLRTAQSLRVTGIGDSYVWSAVTLGNKIYVVEDLTPFMLISRVFVYDIDDSAIRHKQRSQRVISFANRQPLAINGLSDGFNTMRLSACPRTNALYVLEYVNGHVVNDTVRRVHKVKPEDGTVLLQWDFDFSWHSLRAVHSSMSGSYFIMTCTLSVFVYSTSTGALMSEIHSTDENVLVNGLFLAATLVDDTLEDLEKLSSSKRYAEYNVALDDHKLLIVNTTALTVVDTRSDRSQVVSIDDSMYMRFSSYSWYDRASGLIFTQQEREFVVLRITY